MKDVRQQLVAVSLLNHTAFVLRVGKLVLFELRSNPRDPGREGREGARERGKEKETERETGLQISRENASEYLRDGQRLSIENNKGVPK